MKKVLVILVSVSLIFNAFLAVKLLELQQHRKKDIVIIRVLLTFLKYNLGRDINTNYLYEDGKKWVNDPQYKAVPYPISEKTP